MAAPTYIATGTGIAEADASLSVAYPGAITAGDILILQVQAKDVVDNFTTPGGGWAVGDGATANTSHISKWYWLRAAGGETGTVTMARGAGAVLFQAWMHQFRGCVASGTPFEAATAGTDNTASPVDPQDTVTLGSERFITYLGAIEDDVAGAAPSDMTGGTVTVPELVADFSTIVGTDGTLAIWGVARTGGAETFNPGSYTTALTRNRIHHAFALIPAASGTAWTQAVDDTLALADAMTFERQNLIADTLSLSDGISFERQNLIEDTVGLSDSVVFERAINIVDAVSLTDDIIVERGLSVIIDDTVALADMLVQERGLAISDVVAIADALVFDRMLFLEDSFTSVDSLNFQRAITIADVVSISDNRVILLNGIPVDAVVAAVVRKILNRYGVY